MTPTRDDEPFERDPSEKVDDEDQATEGTSRDPEPDPYQDSPGAGIDDDEVPEPNEPG